VIYLGAPTYHAATAQAAGVAATVRDQEKGYQYARSGTTAYHSEDLGRLLVELHQQIGAFAAHSDEDLFTWQQFVQGVL
jgi:hypothetical protein